ncbi:pollen-specific leucine-rich repeat extensin-like protein 4 [Iris pallida]|uniref:Pollen-specific leucine-rich repeat extensin-like protein 4 n=1 Tax=Iris pallida TaxID=29817 RepID=A0AAX6F3I7_IRIPA|nr:pollen-specific leucine-rich repeat extensin-like protein 4 [Iris pallida]
MVVTACTVAAEELEADEEYGYSRDAPARSRDLAENRAEVRGRLSPAALELAHGSGVNAAALPTVPRDGGWWLTTESKEERSEGM